MSESSLSREGLLRILNQVRPALAAQSYVPILNHFCFDGALVLAYNDVQAIGVRYSADIEVSIPGEMLIKLLNSLNGDKVLLVQQDTHVQLKCGRSNLKIPTMPADEFIFDFPKEKKLGSFEVNADFLKGLDKCLISVGDDPTHPAQMGVTIVPGSDSALYSTNNATISKYCLAGEIELPGDAPLILPTFFCTQLISLGKAYPDEEIIVHVYGGALVAELGHSAKLFSKLVLDVEPMDFEKILSRYIDGRKVQKASMKIPDGFEAAFERATIVLSASTDKEVVLSVEGQTAFLHAKSSLGEVSDNLTLDKDLDDFEFGIDPVIVLQGSKACTHMAMLGNVMVLCDEDQKFLHLVSHSRSKKG